MLVNKTSEKVKIIYNGQSRELKPGEGIDIRDFDIETRLVPQVEKRIMSKHPGTYDQKPTVGKDPNADKKYIDEINSLKNRISDLEKEISEVKASEKTAQDRHAATAGEIETAKQDVLSMRKEVDKYKAEKADLEHEIEQLRLGSRKLK